MKKLLAIVFSLSLLIALPALSDGAAEYSDINGHWAAKQIRSFSDLGIIQGYNGAFRPNDSVTRYEMAIILDRVMGYRTAAANNFSDLGTAFYTKAVLKANAAGVMLGSGGKVFPTAPITRQEAAVMLCRVFALTGGGSLTGYADSSQVASWAKDAVAAMTALGYLKGDDGRLRPTSHITRAEVVTILDRAIKKLVSAGETADGKVDGTVVVRGGAKLSDMTVNGDLIIAEGVGDGDVTLENVAVSGRILVRGGGEHSVVMCAVRVNGGVIVNRLDGRVRVVADGDTKVSVRIESGAILVGDGYEEVKIADVAGGETVELKGSVARLVNESETVTIKAEGVIKELEAAVKTDIIGEGVKVEKVSGAARDTVTVNGQSVKMTPASGGSSIGGSDGGGGGGGSSGGGSSGGGGSGSGGGDNSGGGSNVPASPPPADNLELRMSTDYIKLRPDETFQLTAKLFRNGVEVPIPADQCVSWYIKDRQVANYYGGYTEDSLNRFCGLRPGSTYIYAMLFPKGGGHAISISNKCFVMVEGKYTGYRDERFAEGYPVCGTYISDGVHKVQIKVKVPTATTENPVDVYMIVDKDHYGEFNGRLIELDSSSVILHPGFLSMKGGGHPYGNDIITHTVDAAPHVRLTAADEKVIDTDVSLEDGLPIAVYFVIKDREKTSIHPTEVDYTEDSFWELGVDVSPAIEWCYINKARDTIFLSFYGCPLDVTSTPNASAFSLSGVEGVAVSSVFLRGVSYDQHLFVLDLGLRGTTEAMDISGLRLSYNNQTELPLRNASRYQNKVPSFSDVEVKSTNVSLKPLSDVRFSADGNFFWMCIDDSWTGYMPYTKNIGYPFSWVERNGKAVSVFNKYEAARDTCVTVPYANVWQGTFGALNALGNEEITITLAILADGLKDLAMDYTEHVVAPNNILESLGITHDVPEEVSVIATETITKRKLFYNMLSAEYDSVTDTMMVKFDDEGNDWQYAYYWEFVCLDDDKKEVVPVSGEPLPEGGWRLRYSEPLLPSAGWKLRYIGGRAPIEQGTVDITFKP